MRPVDVTKIIKGSKFADTGWGTFAKDWSNALKDTVTKGPKGLSGFVQAFKDLWNIKANVDLKHSMSKTVSGTKNVGSYTDSQ